MKILKKYCFIALSFLLMTVPAICWSTGDYQPGVVTVSTYYNGDLQMIGAYNVRYNPAVSKGSIQAYYFIGGSIAFVGTDSTTATNFACYVSPSSSNYAIAQNILMGAGNGTKLAMVRATSNNQCYNFYVAKSSNYLD